jgi:hypothetical protein
LGRRGGAQRPVLRLNEPEIRVRVARPKPASCHEVIMHIFSLEDSFHHFENPVTSLAFYPGFKKKSYFIAQKILQNTVSLKEEL